LAKRHALKFVALSLFALLLVPACSQTTRYRVLSFFFDGVPPPDAPYTEESLREDTPVLQEQATELTTIAQRPQIYIHSPFQERRCKDCHDMFGGRLRRTPAQGLCAECHPEVPGDALYVHGPVAVNACLECHHFHMSRHPHILLENAKDLCLRCHPQKDLIQGEHHMTIESAADGSCIECHDPHAGSDRLFLKPSDR
jgi:predicted CXXCH cytochrome family protein